MSVILEAIEKKKHGGELSGDIIRWIVDSYSSGKMPPAFSVILYIYFMLLLYSPLYSAFEIVRKAGAQIKHPTRNWRMTPLRDGSLRARSTAPATLGVVSGGKLV